MAVWPQGLAASPWLLLLAGAHKWEAPSVLQTSAAATVTENSFSFSFG